MIQTSEYIKRREQLAKRLNGTVGVVFAGDHAAPPHGRYRADPNFIYLTGIESEQGAAILFDPTNENPNRRITLFLKPLSVEVERWDGYRDELGTDLKKKTGFNSIMRTNHLPGMLTSALRRAKQASCLHPFAIYPGAVSSDLNVFQQVSQRIPGIRIEDKTQAIIEMRAIKSSAEIALLEKAADITVRAFNGTLRHIRPGLNESDIQLALETVYKQQGGGIAYGTIVGSGLNGTVLHYLANDQQLQAGDLMVIDSAASYGGYTADITRTFPVSGKFTSDQRELYELVLKAELAGIKAARPGATFYDVDGAAREVIDKAGLGDAFFHGAGHPLGLVVHDVIPDHPLKPGMVITIEPGIYLRDKKLGIRIEDDLIITKKGNKNITAGVPKTVKDIEAAMKR